MAAAVAASVFADPALQRNMPGVCSQPKGECDCQRKQVSANCIKVEIDLGETTPWTGSMSCALKVFADDDSPSVFTVESLYAALGGYTFKRLGQRNMSDGATPAEVVFSHPRGEPVRFVFGEGESWGRPDPGVHVKMDERLMMVDAEGWAATSNPVYYDLYTGDGTRRRFLATNATGALGKLVSVTDARGVTVTPADMGVDVVYDSNGVRQFLAPSRLANVTPTADFSGYDVNVYAIQEPPAKDPATGLYALPASRPLERVSVRGENGGKRVVVTTLSGDADPLRHVFDYAAGDWSLTRPSGVEERKERYIDDERAARIVHTTVSPPGTVLERTERNYKWEPWGFAMTNRVEGFGGVTDTTEWTYYTSGDGRGQVKTERRQSGLLVQYAYDNADRVVSETRTGPGMMTEATTYSYTPVNPSDPVLPVDTRPRTVVKTLDGVECERTYYVYSPLTNIVERAGTQGAPYGGTNALRTVTAFYPVVDGDLRSGLVASVRHEDGRLDLYDYALVSNLWTETVTHLHEQSPAPVSGKTTRDVTLTNARGEVAETRTEAYIDGAWHVIAQERRTYNLEGRVVRRENLAGQVTTTAWDCCHKVSETQPDGSTTTWDYDDEGRMVASSRLIPLDMTNVTWLTTCYAYDDLGRQVATWQTNYAAQVGLPATRASYDQLGRVSSTTDIDGNYMIMSYSADGCTTSTINQNVLQKKTVSDPMGRILSTSGATVVPLLCEYGILPDGTQWVLEERGETDPRRCLRVFRDMLGREMSEARSVAGSLISHRDFSYDSYGHVHSTQDIDAPRVVYSYNADGNISAVVATAMDGSARTAEIDSLFSKFGRIIKRETTVRLSCTDEQIPALVSSWSRRFGEMALHEVNRETYVDTWGNEVVATIADESSLRIAAVRVPWASNAVIKVERYGFCMMTVDLCAVTNRFEYDFLGRVVREIDGGVVSKVVGYDSCGRVASIADGASHSTSIIYDTRGEIVGVRRADGNVTRYEYDIRGNVVYEGGSVHPRRFCYDAFNMLTNIVYYNDEKTYSGGNVSCDYGLSGAQLTKKSFSDVARLEFEYDVNGLMSSMRNARGDTKTFFRDAWGNATNVCYSDSTPAINTTYDGLGRRISCVDASGAIETKYGAHGEKVSEKMVMDNGDVEVVFHYDQFGRNAGYSLNGRRHTLIEYDAATGRISQMFVPDADGSFKWTYEPETGLKKALERPNGLLTEYRHDYDGRLVEVRHSCGGVDLSRYEYEYDTCGRRIKEIVSVNGKPTNVVQNVFNARGELVKSCLEGECAARFLYEYDDAGNRVYSWERGIARRYSYNNLNQCTSFDESDRGVTHIQYDLDGNQLLTLPVSHGWMKECGNKVALAYDFDNRQKYAVGFYSDTMKTNIVVHSVYDMAGRIRKELATATAPTEIVLENADFYYIDGNLVVKKDAEDFFDSFFIWDPTENTGSCPLMAIVHCPMLDHGWERVYYMQDGLHNTGDVLEELDVECAQTTSADPYSHRHYSYAPFGEVLSKRAGLASDVFLFSSQYTSPYLGWSSFRYRDLDSLLGRWMTREPLSMDSSYLFFSNGARDDWDVLGLVESKDWDSYWQHLLASGVLPANLTEDQRKWAEEALSLGCIGASMVHIGDIPSLDKCYYKMADATLQYMKMKESSQCGGKCPHIFSVHLFNGVGRDRVNPAVDPRNVKEDGSLRMDNWIGAANPLGGGNFDYGYYDVVNKKIISGSQYYNPDGKKFPNRFCNRAMPPTKTSDGRFFIQDPKEWRSGYNNSGYNMEIWCVQCGGDYSRTPRNAGK